MRLGGHVIDLSGLFVVHGIYRSISEDRFSRKFSPRSNGFSVPQNQVDEFSNEPYWGCHLQKADDVVLESRESISVVDLVAMLGALRLGVDLLLRTEGDDGFEIEGQDVGVEVLENSLYGFAGEVLDLDS